MKIFYNINSKIRNYYFYFVFLIFSLASCGKMDATYEGFVKNGTINYTGKADSVKYFPGNEKVELYFILSDPKVKQTKIYWNSNKDSITIPITRINKVDTVKILLTKNEHGITEGSYIFDIYTYDKSGNSSVKVQKAATVYGSTYQTSLLARPIQKVTRTGTNVVIDWYSGSEGVSGVEIIYTDLSGVSKTVLVPASEDQTTLSSFKAGNTFKYRTLFLPEPLAIDTFYTEFTNVVVN